MTMSHCATKLETEQSACAAGCVQIGYQNITKRQVNHPISLFLLPLHGDRSTEIILKNWTYHVTILSSIDRSTTNSAAHLVGKR